MFPHPALVVLVKAIRIRSARVLPATHHQIGEPIPAFLVEEVQLAHADAPVPRLSNTLSEGAFMLAGSGEVGDRPIGVGVAPGENGSAARGALGMLRERP